MTKRHLTPVARKLRRDMTDVEALLWSRLRARQLDGHKFVRQFPIGPHVVDFACRGAKLLVELEGGQHGDAVEADAARTRLMEACRYKVIRFWNNEVGENLDGVLEAILAELRIAFR